MLSDEVLNGGTESLAPRLRSFEVLREGCAVFHDPVFD